MTTIFGNSKSSEKKAEENTICREMVKQMLQFGISQRQVVLLIYLLGLEVENHENMKTICSLVKELYPDILLTSADSEERES